MVTNETFFSRIILQKSAIWTLTFLLIQQIIVASSNFWVVALMADIQLQKDVWLSLLLLLSSLILPYFPGAMSLIFLTKWQNELVINLTYVFVDSNHSNQRLWSNKDAQEKRISILANEGSSTIVDFIDYIYELTSTLTNAVFNIVAISILVTYEFALGYLVSIVFAYLILRLQKKHQQLITNKAQVSRIKWTNIILSSWDNIVLGNIYNFRLWNKKAQKAGENYKKRNLNSEVFNQFISIAIALLTFIPSFVIIIFLIAQRPGDVLMLGSIVVILPRLFSILNYTYQVVRLFARWPAQIQRLKTLRNTFFSREEPQDLESRISWGSLQLYTNSNNNLLNGVNTVHEVMNEIPKIGRITLRGENGSGKSTFLLLLKEEFQNSAFLLPVKHQLNFHAKLNKHSTGQTLKKILEEIEERVEEKVILLDEWDANLDLSNQKELSHLIDDIAMRRCVIEVRHR